MLCLLTVTKSKNEKFSWHIDEHLTPDNVWELNVYLHLYLGLAMKETQKEGVSEPTKGVHSYQWMKFSNLVKLPKPVRKGRELINFEVTEFI